MEKQKPLSDWSLEELKRVEKTLATLPSSFYKKDISAQFAEELKQVKAYLFAWFEVRGIKKNRNIRAFELTMVDGSSVEEVQKVILSTEGNLQIGESRIRQIKNKGWRALRFILRCHILEQESKAS